MKPLILVKMPEGTSQDEVEHVRASLARTTTADVFVYVPPIEMAVVSNRAVFEETLDSFTIRIEAADADELAKVYQMAVRRSEPKPNPRYPITDTKYMTANTFRKTDGPADTPGG